MLSLEINRDRTVHTGYCLPKVETKKYKVMIDCCDFFDGRTDQSIRKFAKGWDNDCTAGYFLDYPYFKESSKAIEIDLRKQQALGADPNRQFILQEIYMEQTI